MPTPNSGPTKAKTQVGQSGQQQAAGRLPGRGRALASLGALGRGYAGRRDQTPALLPTAVIVVLGVLVLSGLSNPATLFNWYLVIIYALFALSANVVVGWNGIGTFGHALYFAAGAYAVALLASHNLPAEVLLLLGAAVGAAIGLVFALAATRTGSLVAMAMLTLMFAQLGYQIVYGVSVFGGENGLVGIPRGSVFGVNLNSTTAFNWYIMIVFGLCWYALVRFRRSTVVRSMLAARDDPTRARAAGLHVTTLRVIGFVVGGMFAGLAGALYSQTEGVIGSDVAYWTTSGMVLIMVIIGGTGRLWGPVIGAALYTWGNVYLLHTTSTMNVYLGAALLVILLVAPQGIAQLPVSSTHWVTAKVLRRWPVAPAAQDATTGKEDLWT